MPRTLPLLLLFLPTLALAETQEIRNQALGPHWLGANYLDNLGWRAVAPGDLNGDGLSDFVVSSPQDTGPATFNSVLRIYFGQAHGPPASGDARWEGVRISDPEVNGDAVFEFDVVPDLTGDGVPDLLVAEPFAGDNGKVVLYAGADGAWPTDLAPSQAAAIWTGYTEPDPLEPGLAAEAQPSHVASGDLNGDGVADAVIGSARHRKVWVDLSAGAFAGEASLQDAEWSFVRCQGTADAPTRNASEFARDLAVGDFDADGVDDLVISAPGCEGGEGRVFLWYGGPDLDPEAPDLSIGGGDHLGGALNVDDLNGDGVDDLFIQELRSGPDANRSNLWIHLGGPSGLVAAPDVTIAGGAADVRFGEAVTMLRDISNPEDGLPELVVGAPETAHDGLGQGAVYIFEGLADWSGAHDVSEAKYVAFGAHRGAWFGATVAALDDFDGDGNPEIVIGEPNFTDGDAENDYRRGRIYLLNVLPDRDQDGDGVGTVAGDCDDTDAAVSPNGTELCDGIDNNCDRLVDEGCDGDDDDAADDDDSIYVEGPGDSDPGCGCRSGGRGGGALGLLLLPLAWRRRRRGSACC